MVEACKNHIWLDSSMKFLIFIIQFSWGQTDQENGASFMLSLVVKFGQIIPFRFHPLIEFFTDFHWDLSGNWINIYNLCYNAAVLKEKESVKLLKVTVLLGPYLGKTWASMSHAQNQIQDHKLSRIFYFIKIS